MPILYKHKNNTDVAIEVLKITRIPGKDYIRIKAKWWNIVPSHAPYDMQLGTFTLTDATIQGNKRNREKYPLKKWNKDWEVYNATSRMG